MATITIKLYRDQPYKLVIQARCNVGQSQPTSTKPTYPPFSYLHLFVALYTPFVVNASAQLRGPGVSPGGGPYPLVALACTIVFSFRDIGLITGNPYLNTTTTT